MTGIGGVLGGLISGDTSARKPSEAARHGPRKGNHARPGRPPGKASAKSQPRLKLTVRIDADLVEEYRDWSWDARCNLGELVGVAMRRHLRTRCGDN